MREFEGSLTKRLVGHSGPVYACKFFHPEAQRFAISVSQDETARLWSLDLFTCLVVFRGHSGPIWDVDVAPLGAGPYFVTASADRTARLWSCEQAQALRIFAGHLSDVDVVRFHPNGNYLVTGSADKTLRMWDIQNGACVRLFAGHSRGISALVFSPDGRYLVSADRGGQIRVWDLAEGKLLRSIRLRGATVSRLMSSNPGGDKVAPIPYSVELDMDGRVLAVAGSDQLVHLFEMAKLVVPTPAITTSTEASPSSPITDLPGLLVSYPTKQTPIFKLQFTYRNVLIGAGPYQSDD